MCYYNGIKVTRDEYIRLKAMEKRFALEFQRKVQSGFEYANWPIVIPTAGYDDFDIQLAHWELIPYWVQNMDQVKESRKKFTTLNATAEKLLESKMFQGPAMHRRCLVLSSGFYEWRHFKPQGEKKAITYPYYITAPDKEYFFMAGIYQPWTDKATGETFNSFAIVTTEANTLMTGIHNTKKRMPTILPEDLAWEWLQKDLSLERIRQLAAYKEENSLIAHTVRKDFRTIEEPEAPFHYSELPPLEAI